MLSSTSTIDKDLLAQESQGRALLLLLAMVPLANQGMGVLTLLDTFQGSLGVVRNIRKKNE